MKTLPQEPEANLGEAAPKISDDNEPVLDHEITGCWPLVGGGKLSALTDSIKENGLRLDITLYEGKILDGRHRYRACRDAGVKPRFTTFSGSDPVRFAIDANHLRRHETTSQRAWVAAKLATLKHGSNQFMEETSNDVSSASSQLVTIDRAAELMNVSPASVDRARRVLANASPEIIEKVNSGEMTVTTALATFEPTVAAPKRTVMPKAPPNPSNLVIKILLMLCSVVVCGLRYAAIKKILDYLLSCYPNLKDEVHERYDSRGDSLDLADEAIKTLQSIPEDDPGRFEVFKEAYVVLCKACPDLDEGRQREIEAANRVDKTAAGEPQLGEGEMDHA